MVLEDTSERRIIKSKKVYADIPLGLYIIRGDTVILMGEIGVQEGPGGLTKINSLEEFAKVELTVDEDAEKKLHTEWDFDQDLI